jgi:hypothetical protein
LPEFPQPGYAWFRLGGYNLINMQNTDAPRRQGQPPQQ